MANRESRDGAGQPPPRKVVIMGPSGCGKSTLAGALAAALGWQFIEGDDFHPPENKAKMARGEPLTEADRAPFLNGVGEALARAPDGTVASCSALRRTHRDRLRQHAGRLLFVLPNVPRAELKRRLEQRRDSFMPPSLLDSQLAALEPPTDEEEAVEIDGTLPVAEEVRLVRACLGC